MKWLKTRFGSNKTGNKTHNNNHFRHEYVEEVKRKLEVGEMISGFLLESTGTNDTLVAFGGN